ncbi:MAG: lipid-A-disaccharide synthase [Bacteroidaceae bacterium]
MKYYLIVGEASGDLHASNLMKALQHEDPQAEFRFFGGDLMSAVGGTRVKHYRELAYMGVIPVLLHLRTILSNMRLCRRDIVDYRPDVLILVDYPGFNLSVAQYVKAHTHIPVFYYISPKIWAWKEYRIKNIRRDVDALFSILPFEVDFYRKHQYEIHYVGNPCVDAVAEFRASYVETEAEFRARNGLGEKPLVALLAGSRRQEIADNLSRMLQVAAAYPDYRFVLAGAPGIEPEFYRQCVGEMPVPVVFGQTYALLTHACAALVTSGTATLETALFRVPQVVCYYMKAGRIVSLLRRWVLRVPFVSLVNLIAGKEVVRELVAADMTVPRLHGELESLLHDDEARARMLADYDRIIRLLGPAGASGQAARKMCRLLRPE